VTPNQARWLRLSQLFDHAIDLDPAQREALLDAECADDPTLRAELQRMLDADAADSAFDAGAHEIITLHDEDDAGASDDVPAARLGPWRIDRELGRGGMGTVHAAHRDDDTAQRAAVKRLRRRWDGSTQAQRFLQERRILAALSHPNIPRLLDNGVDNDGRPWFALEFIDGSPLTTWADTRRLPLRERVALFGQVCEAVQHAHEHFVVHRDLKPANILVDAGGRAKVLDFGVAKRIDEDAGSTRTGMFAGFTPEYAAPEQMSGGPITAATDVHALGVVLFQLLTGRLPFTFAPDDLRAAAEAISRQPPPRLEQAITTGTEEEVATRLQERRTDTRAFRRFVRGDLGRILQTALAKEPARRYGSVRAFADDLQRFLDGRPVSVSGDTLGYRAGKFVRRNRLGVAMTALAVFAMIGGTAFSLYRAEQERIQRERSEVVLGFMSDLFQGQAVDGGFGNQLTAVDLLDRAAGRIDGVCVEDPQGKATLLNVVAGAYVSIGMHEQAVAYATQAMEVAGGLRDTSPDTYLLAVFRLVEALSDHRRYPDVVAVVDRELAYARRHGGTRPWAAHLMRKRGYAQFELGNLDAAEQDLLQAIANYEELGETVDGASEAYTDLALVVSDKGDPRQALRHLHRSNAIDRALPGPSELTVAINQINRAREHFRIGENAQAITLLEAAIPEFDALIGPAYSRTIIARNLLAQAYAAQGRNADAVVAVERNLEFQRASPGNDPVMLAISDATRAKLLVYSGRASDALPVARQSLDFLRTQYPDPTPLRGRAAWILGETLLQLHRCDEAAPELRAALSDEQASTGDTPTTNAGEAYDSLGRCRLQQGDPAGAEELLARAHAHFTGAMGPEHPRTLRSDVHRLWAAHARSGDPSHLHGIRERRTQLVALLATQDTPVVWQLDLLLDELADGQAPFALDPRARTQLRRKLAEEAGTDQPPAFFGLNSFS
jgi:eukaryotic-like serine/threonine-protein kinase